MAIICFKINTADNVVTMLADIDKGAILIEENGPLAAVSASQPVELGHKVAVADIEEGLPIIKFGVPIGVATQSIRPGDWVHLHNCRSRFDIRSATLDLHTGATTDISYD